MAIKIQPVTKTTKPLKVLLYGPTWSGKTYGAIKLGVGLVMKKRNYTNPEDAYKHIVLIDSEYGRATQYASFGPFLYVQQQAPYLTEDLVAAVKDINIMPDIDVIVIDSLTHYWSKDGGILEQKANKDKSGIGNSYTNWQEFTAKFNTAISSILSSPKVIIATARAKSDTVILKDDTTNKSTIKTIGLKPDLRDDIDFEFDIVFNIDKENHSLVTVKGIPGMLGMYEPITEDLGVQLQTMATDGATLVRDADEIINTIKHATQAYNLLNFVQVRNNGRKLSDMSVAELLACEADIVKEIQRIQVDKTRGAK